MKDNVESKCPFGFGNDAASEGAAPTESYASTHQAMAPALSRAKLPELVKEPIEPGQDNLPTGRCLCGKVSFQVNKPVEKVFANHDAASRRWTGGIALTFMIRATNTKFNGWGSLVHRQANEREVHGFCRICGSSMFVRHLAPEMMDGMLSISAGTLDSTDGMRLAAETYVDEKPALYSFDGERRMMTGAEVESMFG